MENQMGKIFGVGVLFAASLAVSPTSYGDSLHLRLATDGAYPPYASLDPSGKLIGLEVDLATDLCKRLEATCEWITQDFNGMIPALQGGRFDVIMASMSITDERRKTIDFSVPYVMGPTFFLASVDSPIAAAVKSTAKIELTEVSPEERASLEEIRSALKGHIVGVERSTTHETFVKKYFGDVVDMRLYDKEAALQLDLVSGRIDVALSGLDSIDHFIEEQKKDGREFAVLGPALQGGELGFGVALGLKKGNDDLRKRLNEAIIAATEDGTIATLTTEWLHSDISIPIETLRKSAQ
jgi:octopine/nopaline transport system substrate-binding protein